MTITVGQLKEILEIAGDESAEVYLHDGEDFKNIVDISIEIGADEKKGIVIDCVKINI